MTLSFHYQPSLKSISNPSIIPLHCRPSNILGSAIKMYCKVLSIAIVTMTRYSPCFELGRVCPDQAHVAPVLVVDKTAAEESSELEAVWSCLKLFEAVWRVSRRQQHFVQIVDKSHKYKHIQLLQRCRAHLCLQKLQWHFEAESNFSIATHCISLLT